MPPSSRDRSSSRAELSTYRSILCRKNPDIIDIWDGSSFTNTRSGKDVFDLVVFSGESNYTIQDWTDFTYEAINLAYGDLLDHVPSDDWRIRTPTVTPTTIKDENGIDHLSTVWTCNIVRDPLKHAGVELRKRPTVCSQAGQLESDPALVPKMMEWTHPRWTKTQLKPDWAISDRSVEKLYYSASAKDRKKPLVYAIGDSKMCQKWKSEWIHKSLAGGYIDRSPAIPASGIPLQKTHNVTEERLRPLEQLATYCRYGETRYGFILTQIELVAFRVRRLDPALIPNVVGYNKPFAGIEYKSVPWDASGPGELTANLAIWALGCMGMNDHHRSVETTDGRPLDSMVRLTKWTRDEETKVYRNDISGRGITEDGWKKLGNAVNSVKLDDKEGVSYTSTFTTGSGIASITQGVAAVNLKFVTSSGRELTQDATQQSKPSNQRAASSS